MKICMPICLLLFLGACGFTPLGDTIRSAVKEGGAQIMDESLINTEWWLCQGASIGSIKRRYGGNKAASYNELCNESGDGIIGGREAMPTR